MSPASQLTPAFPCLLKRLVLPITMNTEKNFKSKKFLDLKRISSLKIFLIKSVQFCKKFHLRHLTGLIIRH